MEEEAEETGRLEMDAAVEEEPGAAVEEASEVEAGRLEVGAAVEEKAFRPAGHQLGRD